jgi:thiosulfate/3-mercaptopyruvate sulfurtransferase
VPLGKSAAADFQLDRIPGSQFFDIDGVADPSSGLPHMLPSEPAFAAAMDALEVGNNTHVVLYDRVGLFSAPRAWWTFKVFGHDRWV